MSWMFLIAMLVCAAAGCRCGCPTVRESLAVTAEIIPRYESTAAIGDLTARLEYRVEIVR